MRKCQNSEADSMVLLENALKPVEEVSLQHQETLELLRLYQRMINYLAAAQIYLQGGSAISKEVY
jgi:phosphoketolase